VADLVFESGMVHLQLSRWEKVGAFSNDVSFPVGAIESVECLANARSAIRGVRFPGTGLPGVIALGKWRRSGAIDFVAVYKNQPGYVIELAGQRVERIILSCEPIAELDALG